MKKKILITGVCGVVGSLLKEKLTKDGFDIFGCDLLHQLGERGYIQKMSHEKPTYSRADISNYRQIKRIFEEFGPFDIVYNCAAEFGRWNGEDYFEQLWNSNTIGLKNILQLQNIYKFKLIHFSTSEVYGDLKEKVKENVMNKKEVQQLNDYALSKWVNEIQIKNNNQINKKNQTVVVRLFNTYGPGEHYHSYRSVTSKFLYHAMHKLPITVYKNHIRSSTYIYDCVNALSKIAKRFISGRTYNICSSKYHSMGELIEIIQNVTKIPNKLITFKNEEVLTTKIKKADNSLSKKELKFEDTISLEEGISITYDWLKNFNKK